MKLTCIVPCFNEEEVLEAFYAEITRVFDTMPEMERELLFVDDGSRDKTLEIIKKFREQDDTVKYVSFSRNFGKEAGILAGLRHSMGDLVVVMDADLQHPPRLLPEMVDGILKEGYDIVGARRATREKEPKIRSFFSRNFYRLINKMSSTDITQGACDYQLMKRKVVDSVLELGEYNRFTKGIFSWVGFKKKWLSYENVERAAGDSKWSIWSLTKYAVEGILAFSTTPLLFASVIGIIFCLVAFAIIVFVVAKTLMFGDPVGGWPSLVCLIMMVSGIQLFCMGIMGQYLAKTYLETKQRPVYIIGECETECESMH